MNLPMPDSFDSADGRTHSYGDACKPTHVMPETCCPSCGGPISPEAERTTARLLANLDDRRRERLTLLYQTHGAVVPEHLCADCFLPLVGVLNQGLVA